MQQVVVIHADVKPDNMLVNDAKKSFTLDRLNEVTATPFLVRRFCRAPEIMMGLKYSYPLDLWSVACTLYEIWTGKMLFKGKDNNEMLKVCKIRSVNATAYVF
eukprot:m.229714 g.229714  ORF g.229714 m.229714 type:complete len:103 (+) comp13886_c0_seq3:268-576(+)